MHSLSGRAYCPRPKETAVPKPKCSSPQCDRESFCKGFCYSHYRRMKRGGDTSTPIGLRDVVELTNTRVPADVAKLVRAVAEGRGVTEYKQMQDILCEWYERVTGKPAVPHSNGVHVNNA